MLKINVCKCEIEKYKLQRGIAMITDFDFTILNAIQGVLRNPVLDKIMVFITTLGNGGVLWIILSVLLLFSKKYRPLGIMIAIGLILDYVFGNLILKTFVARERPFNFNENISLLISAPKDFSFPSGHTLASFTTALIVYKVCKKWGIFLIVLASLIAFSRLYLYVHYPSDVVAGLLFALLFSW